jgi:hypothetical protein
MDQQHAVPDAPAPADRLVGDIRAWVNQIVHRYPRLLLLAWFGVTIAWCMIPVSAYYAWYILIGRVGDWAAADSGIVRWTGATFAWLLLLGIPLWVTMFALSFTQITASLSLSVEGADLESARSRVRETEEEAINRLESTDAAGLLPLLKYSRAQLDAYYDIGLRQTRRSFVNAAIAMWLGFMILCAGIFLYIGPVERLGLKHPTENFNTLILGSAAIVEFIAALFLWVYRSTIGQLTFYYRLQMRSHTAILCFRMATSMEHPDEAKRSIIEKVLDWSMMPERPPVMGGQGLANLLGKPGP